MIMAKNSRRSVHTAYIYCRGLLLSADDFLFEFVFCRVTTYITFFPARPHLYIAS